MEKITIEALPVPWRKPKTRKKENTKIHKPTESHTCYIENLQG